MKRTADSPSNVQYYDRVTDDELRWLYSKARALVSVSSEDFGLTPLEANAFGTPSLLLRAGGFLDTMAANVSGQFITSPALTDIVSALDSFPDQWDKDKIREHAAKFSLEVFSHRMNDLLATID